MIKTGSNKIRVTRSELNTLRQRAAQNGVAVNSVCNELELLEAIIHGLDTDTAEDILTFIVSRGGLARPPDKK